MEAVLSKWGNSLGLRIPSEIASSFKLRAGSRVSLTADGSQITLKPINDIRTLFEAYYGKPLENITKDDVGDYEEIDWGPDVGREVID
ncbi:MAG: AbrB/MazE/SpoVT family DNA-binding domain-containing protein [Selenomonas sp.]|nr:AbrB/MazE/SpoVT family DNA-binding domain-containing protein [Selenomonas sp.]